MNESLWLKFMSRVEASPSGCHEWQGPKNGCGYAAVSACYGAATGHRAVWAHFNGPIPAGMFVCHTCDNPACVRIEHLFLGTPADNVRDKVSKGRQARKATHGEYLATGSRHGAYTHPEKFQGEGARSAKLTVEQVAEIRRRIGPRNGAALAREYGVGKATINAIKHGRTWQYDFPDKPAP